MLRPPRILTRPGSRNSQSLSMLFLLVLGLGLFAGGGWRSSDRLRLGWRGLSRRRRIHRHPDCKTRGGGRSRAYRLNPSKPRAMRADTTQVANVPGLMRRSKTSLPGKVGIMHLRWVVCTCRARSHECQGEPGRTVPRSFTPLVVRGRRRQSGLANRRSALRAAKSDSDRRQGRPAVRALTGPRPRGGDV